MFAVSNISIFHGGTALFNGISYQISKRDKIGLTGRNGAGKSTMLKIIAGEKRPDEGEILVPKEATVGYLAQEIDIKSDKSVLAETRSVFARLQQLQADIEYINEQLATRTDYESEGYMELITQLSDKQNEFQMAGGYNVDGEVEKVLKGLGFEQKDMERPVREFSGGWQMRVELAKILLQQPDLLLLDEPTNHLDIESIRWLEDYLQDYPGAIILISHDRQFLDHVTNRTIEITLGRIEDYKAPYSKYVMLRAERREQLESAQRNQEKEIQQIERNIERFRAKATKAKFAQSLIKKLDKIDRIEVDNEDTTAIRIRFPEPPRSGLAVVGGKNVRKSFGENNVITGLDFAVERGDRVAFVGKNGMGKSTLSKIIAGELDYEGDLQLGSNVHLGYYAQHQVNDQKNKQTVLEEMEKASAGTDAFTQVRSILGAFLFSGEDVNKKVRVLSGGEKSRLELAKLLLRPVNLLVMDEPTNHLDMVSKNVLKQALLEYQGTLIVVSHDRDFLAGLTDKVFEFRKGEIKPHLGDVNTFLEARKVEDFRAFELEKEKQKAQKAKVESANKSDYAARKQRDKDLRKAQNAVKKHEQAIEKLEGQVQEMDDRLMDPVQYKELINDQDFYAAYEAKKQELSAAMEAWEAAQLALEELESQD